MTAIELAALVAGTATLLVSVLSQIELWQRKEYRFDRIISHWRSPQGSLANYPIVSLALLLVGLGWFAYLTDFPVLADFTGLIALLAFTAYQADVIARRGLRRPDFTVKAISIFTVTLAVFAIYFASAFAFDILIALQLATLLFFLPALVGIVVLLVNLPFAFRKRQIIRRAAALRESFPQLKVVGITGSYGKTSTKHFLAQILKSAGQRVAATQDHHNTPIGVAQDMLQQLKPDLEIYIAELGAYRRGEIKELAQLIRPDIGIITAIGNQHIDLFGSQSNILKGKWELIEALPQAGTAILNGEDQLLMSQAVPPQVKLVKFFPSQHDSLPAMPQLSPLLIGNVIAAYQAALQLGVSRESLATVLPSLKTFARTMEVKHGRGGAQVIDDSYSANETGVLSAIQQLASLPHTDKRIILLPLIELGSEASAVHARIGQAIRASGAKLFVFGRAYEQELGPGVYVEDPKRLAALASAGLSKNSAVLLENRIPDVVRKVILA